MNRYSHLRLVEAEHIQDRPEPMADAAAVERRLAAHRLAQRRRLFLEHLAIALLIAAAFVNAAWQLGWL